MTEEREAQLLAQVDLLAAQQVENHHEQGHRTLKNSQFIIGILAVIAITEAIFLHSYASDKLEAREFRLLQVQGFKNLWFAEHTGDYNVNAGTIIGPASLQGRTANMVGNPFFDWDWPFRHPANPGFTFREFAESSDHPFARELKKHLP